MDFSSELKSAPYYSSSVRDTLAGWLTGSYETLQLSLSRARDFFRSLFYGELCIRVVFNGNVYTQQAVLLLYLGILYTCRSIENACTGTTVERQ